MAGKIVTEIPYVWKNRIIALENTPRKNAIINGGFTINQRVYVSAATLATAVYGHDRWKAGAGGGDYSFTQLASPTTITIAANKTLIQVVEDKNVYGGTYVLSWTGTCQARYAINSATPAGAYADSPIIIAGQTAGTTMSVEFGKGAASGTLGLIQLELGSVTTPFEFRPYQQELALCQRYYQLVGNTTYPVSLGGMAPTLDGGGNYRFYNPIFLATAMRTAGTVKVYSGMGDTVDKVTVGDSGIYGGDPANIDSSGSPSVVIGSTGGYIVSLHNALYHIIYFYMTIDAEL